MTCYHIQRLRNAGRGREALDSRVNMLHNLKSDSREYAKRLDNIIGTLDTEAIFMDLRKVGEQDRFLDIMRSWTKENLFIFVNEKLEVTDIQRRIELKFDVDLHDEIIIIGRGRNATRRIERAANNFSKIRLERGEKYVISDVQDYRFLAEKAKSILIRREL